MIYNVLGYFMPLAIQHPEEGLHQVCKKSSENR